MGKMLCLRISNFLGFVYIESHVTLYRKTWRSEGELTLELQMAWATKSGESVLMAIRYQIFIDLCDEWSHLAEDEIQHVKLRSKHSFQMINLKPFKLAAMHC